MYSPDPECGVCGSMNVDADECRVGKEYVEFWRCRECGALTPNMDDEMMVRQEAEADKLVKDFLATK